MGEFRLGSEVLVLLHQDRVLCFYLVWLRY